MGATIVVLLILCGSLSAVLLSRADVAPAGSDTAEPDTPIPTAERLVGPGWRWIEVATSPAAANFSARLSLASPSGHAAWAVFVYRGDALDFAASAALTDTHGVRIRTMLASDEVRLFPRGDSARETGMEVETLNPQGATFSVALWTAGDVSEWSWSFHTSGGAAVAGVAGGTRTFFEPNGGSARAADASVGAMGTSLAATLEATRTIDAAHGLIGEFGFTPNRFSPGAATGVVDGPDGSRDCLPRCTLASGSPGTYHFRWSSAGGATDERPAAYLLLADAHPPGVRS